MVYKTQSKYYTSTHSYPNTNDIPIHGGGQKSGNGDNLWNLISIQLLEGIDKFAPGCTIQPPKSNTTRNIKIMVFVDDKRHYINLIFQHFQESLEEAINRSVNMCDELLTFVGGKLEMSKYGFYIIQWSFDANEKPISNENRPTITFKAEEISIKSTRLQNDEALIYLGVTSQPSGDQSAQTNALI